MTETALAVRARIDQELAGLGREMRHRIARLGLFRTLCVVLLASILLYALDRTLTPPPAVRLLFTGLLLALAGGAAWRFLLRPLRQPIAPAHMALALEKRFPELAQVLISGIQLGATESADGISSEMIAALLERAEKQYSQLPTRDIFDPRPSRWFGLGLLALLLICLGGLWLRPGEFTIFGQRLVGLEVSYPRATHLNIILPPTGPTIKVHGDQVMIARGADLTVTVQVTGKVPDLVLLVGSDGTEETMGPKDRKIFKFTYRAVSQPFSFHATGGDDPGDREIGVKVVNAPAVAAIMAEIHSPLYTGQPLTKCEGGPIEGLMGAQVKIAVKVTEPISDASLTFDSGLAQPLEMGPEGRLLGEFILEKSDRYRVRLTGTSGLRNVRPGSHPIMVIPDTKPRITIVTPARMVTPFTFAGVIPIRLTIKDDFGIANAQIRIKGPDKTIIYKQDFTWPENALTRNIVELIPLSQLQTNPVKALCEGDTCHLEIVATDNCTAKPNASAIPPDYRIDLVASNSLEREVSDLLMRRRRELAGAIRSQEDLCGRLDAVAAVTKDQPSFRTGLQGIQNGQARLGTLAKHLREQLVLGFNLYLFGGANVMPSQQAAPIQARYLAHYQPLPSQPPSDPAFYKRLKKDKDLDRLGITPLPGLILDMMDLALTLEKEAFPGIEKELAGAIAATTMAAARTHRERARKCQDEALAILLAIQEMLTEWNEFDDVLRIVMEMKATALKISNRTKNLPGR